MKRFVVIEKKLGETPLQALECFRATDVTLKDVPMTYAGRLDPMATGKLLILIGEECKKKDEYNGLDKEYEFEILLGIGSDTGDVLGLPSVSSGREVFVEAKLHTVLKDLVGDITFPYPTYSSKTVEGKALFQHAHEGTLTSVKHPEVTTRLYTLKYVDYRRVSSATLHDEVMKKINTLQVPSDPKRLGSDFRKEEIMGKWKEVLSGSQQEFVIVRSVATVSSGTYIRSLASHIGERLGTTGLAFSIHRTVIGKYFSINRGFGWWTKKIK